MTEVPESAFPRCLVCDTPVHHLNGALFEIAGFEKERGQGGTNHVIARKRTGKLVGPCCARRVQDGVSWEQETLL